MVKKLQKLAEKKTAGAAGLGGVGALLDSELAKTVRDSAQQIWLAGLGAFSKAQEEGGKVFQALVKEGMSLQRKTQTVAGDKLTDATSRMASMATEISSKASGQWDKLETIFEERVARALKKLGVPTAKEIDALATRVEELNRTVASMRSGPAPARSAARPAAAKRPAGKAVRKRAPVRKVAE